MFAWLYHTNHEPAVVQNNDLYDPITNSYIHGRVAYISNIPPASKHFMEAGASDDASQVIDNVTFPK